MVKKRASKYEFMIIPLGIRKYPVNYNFDVWRLTTDE
jgi:hypothetical protein